LTLENLKKIARGMKQPDVEKLLSGSGTFRGYSSKDAEGRAIQVCEWSFGQEIRAYIKDGKVNGSAYVGGKE
jgi:hypothetical protein